MQGVSVRLLVTALVATSVWAAASASADDFDALLAEAEQAREAGELERALEAFERALELRPDWTEGHWTLGTLLYDLDRCEGARDHFEAHLAQSSDDALAWALMGLCGTQLGEHEASVAELRRALELGVPHAAIESAAGLQLALLVNRHGNPDLALEMLRPFAHRGQDSVPVIQAFGLALLRMPLLPWEVPEGKRDMILLAGRGAYRMSRMRRNATGLLALEELATRYPSEPNVHYALGLYLQPEDPDRAAREFRRELEIAPDNYVAMLQLASMELRRGELETALGMSERAFGLAPESPATHLMLGRALLQQGEIARALKLLETGARMAPESHEFQFALARAYRRAGRPEDAARADERFRELKGAEGGRENGRRRES